MAQILTTENVDKLNEFLLIRQNEIFILAIS